MGRRYFHSSVAIRSLTWGIVIGGLLYAPLTLFEVRMSPQLSNMIYGIFPHSWLQHSRYGGFRPIVFLEHGLMVSLWMAVAFMVTYWFWRTKQFSRVFGIPAVLATAMLLLAGIFCRSANGWFFLAAGLTAFTFYRRTKKARIFRYMMALIPLYIIVRIMNVIPAESIEYMAGLFFDDERVGSLAWRLMQEGLFGSRALERPFLGWGGYGRGWPVDPTTGERMIRMVDAFWVVIFSSFGFVGLSSVYIALGIGPWCALRKLTPSIDEIVLSLMVIFYMIDTLFNGMINPIYFLATGALVGRYLDISSPKEMEVATA